MLVDLTEKIVVLFHNKIKPVTPPILYTYHFIHQTTPSTHTPTLECHITLNESISGHATYFYLINMETGGSIGRK